MPTTVRVLAALVAALLAALLAAAPAPARTVVKTGWKVDLGTDRVLEAVTVHWRRRSTGRHRLQTSLDGKRFATAASLSGRHAKVRVRLDRPARFVRLTGRAARAPRLVVKAAPAPTGPAWRGGILPPPLPASTGTRRYVATSGSDANPGTMSQPWRSIQHALDSARPGDLVYVRGGRYEGTAGVGPDRRDGVGPSVNASPQGRPGSPITLAAHPGEQPVISGFVTLPHPSWFRMTGLIIDGRDAPKGAQGVSLGNSTRGVPRHVELSYNEIRNFQSPDVDAHGILHFSGEDTALIGNRIHDIGAKTFYDHGIYLKAGRRVVVVNNVIEDITGGYGLHIWGDFDDSWVINNTVAGSAASGFTIGGNSDRGRPDRVVVSNNILASSRGNRDAHQGYAAKEYQPGAGNSVRNNLGWANARPEPFALSATGPRANRTADPRFRGGLAISRRGAAYDRGEDFGLLLDAAGRRRDARPDLGAYEAP